VQASPIDTSSSSRIEKEKTKWETAMRRYDGATLWQQDSI